MRWGRARIASSRSAFSRATPFVLSARTLRAAREACQEPDQPIVNHVFARWAQGTARCTRRFCGEIDMEPFRQSMRPRGSYATAENILRIGQDERRAAPPPVGRDAELSRKGQAALDLV